ncbi:class I SAM-dependent methyltransferase [bacterium]|nr:class I SAM-dependent methyltransferase [bacterium]
MSLIPGQKETYWSKFAEDFDKRNEYVVGAETIGIVKEKLQRQKNLGSLLELGCGNGMYTQAIATGADNIIATDFSGEMLGAVKNALKGNPEIELEKADCLNLHYEDESFDSVFMANLIHVISDPGRALQEARRVLKPGGILLLLDFTGDGMRFFSKIGMIVRYLKTYGKPPKSATNFGLGNLTAFIEKYNFQIEEAVLLGDKTKAVFTRAGKTN